MNRSIGFAVCMLFVAAAWAVPQQRRAAPRPSSDGRLSARWIGQDGHDFVGPNSELKPSDVQDMVIQISGLPARLALTKLVVKGHGGDEWQWNGPNGPWRAHLARAEGSSTAHVYLEPSRVEKGRSFQLIFTFDDGRTTELYIDGGKADPTLRMPTARLSARWLGQDGRDRVGPTAAVGPDGYADVLIALDRLSSHAEIQAIELQSGNTRWAAGLNPERVSSAEWAIDAEDRTAAIVFLAAEGLQPGATLEISVTYQNGTRDQARVKAGPVDPQRAVQKPPIRSLRQHTLSVQALGQASDPEGANPGVVRVGLSGLPGQPIVAAALTNSTGTAWVWKARAEIDFEVGTNAQPLKWERGGRPGTATIVFAPVRNEQGAPMMLRWRHADGSEAFARWEGPECDPTRISPQPSAARATARPGDDLQALAARGGTVQLSKGTYRLTRPLVLEKPVRLIGEPGVSLQFEQAAADRPWTAAVQIHAGNTTLEGFAVRFVGPVRWDWEVAHGPAIIGTSDDRDKDRRDPKAGLRLAGLDIEAPLPVSDWEMSPHPFRLLTAANGVIERNRLRAGRIELEGGPWRVVENEHRGAHPGSYAHAVLSVHRTHDLVVERNRVHVEGPSGKTWRFLVMTQGGTGDVVRDNRVSGVGPVDADYKRENAPEVVLTESYRLCFEGRPWGVSSQGWVLMIPEPQGRAGEPGDVVVILAGPHRGSYRRIAQRIDRNTYLLDDPLPTSELADYPAVSVTEGGFTGLVFERNQIDGPARSKATGFVLVGQHFGTIVRENVVRGCEVPMRITAAPTERPVMWGWSHAPMFGLKIEGNRFEGCERPALLAVEWGAPIKSSAGRLYLTARLDRSNTGSADAAWIVGDGAETSTEAMEAALVGGSQGARPAR